MSLLWLHPCRLHDPSLVGQSLGDLQRVYTAVVGQQPEDRLLTSANSSYMRNTPAVFKAKLQQLVDE
jgi:hypothetical protein